MIEITINGPGALAALARVQAGLSNLEPALRTIGEYIMELSKSSFAKSASPDGDPWAPNQPSTVLNYLRRTGGNYTKSGKLSKKGAQRVAGKKPLIGASRDLARQFSYVADAHSVTIGNAMRYAAMQQFGGSQAEFPNLWGDIPARPFMPIDAGGELSKSGRTAAIAAIDDYLDALVGS